jgi:hypothetical protein
MRYTPRRLARKTCRSSSAMRTERPSRCAISSPLAIQRLTVRAETSSESATPWIVWNFRSVALCWPRGLSKPTAGRGAALGMSSPLPINQRAEIFNTPRGDTGSELDRLRKAARFYARPPCRLADGNRSTATDNRVQSDEAGLRKRIGSSHCSPPCSQA